MNRHPSADRPPDINQERRWLLGVAATALAGTWLDGVRIPAQVIAAQTTGVATRARNAGPTFGTIKQVKAGVLDVGYVESGPVDGRVVLLLHGWPYDVHTYDQVAPRLESAAYRVIVPYLRGYGTTRFRSGDTFRNGQQAALAQDVIALMGCARDPAGDRRRVRLGRAHRQYHGGALA